MSKLPSSRTLPQGSIDGSEPVPVRERPMDCPSISTDVRHAASEFDDRIAIWVNEGGAGGEVVRTAAI